MPSPAAQADEDRRQMAYALELARSAGHRTSPNPMVGAVVLDAEGGRAGEGLHTRAGEPHAEALALAAAGARSRGGTLYVTLEPCDHRGRTPPCTQAILAAAPERVVVAMEDPDPRVRGRGIARLRDAGIRVELGLLGAEAARLNEKYVVHRTLGRPLVTLKWAMTIDGRIATRSGSSRWISGERSREHAHRLRHENDAVLVGIGTVLADDPDLGARLPGARQPLRVVLDSSLRTPARSRLARAGTLVATAARDGGAELAARGAELLRLPPDGAGRPQLLGLLSELAGRGVLGLLVEGGAEVHASFVAAGLVDRLVVYVAPVIVGGRTAPGPVAGGGVAELAGALRLGDLEVERLGGDLVLTAGRA